MRILIVNLTRIGDQLQTSPTVAGLRARHPDAEITVLGDRHQIQVCRSIPGIDRIYEIDLDRIGEDLLAGGTRIVEAYRYAEGIVQDLRGQRFDLAVNFSSSRMSAVFMRLLRIPDCRGWTADSEGHRLIVHPWSRLFVASVLNRRYAVYNLVDCFTRVAGVRAPEPRLWYEPGPEAEAAAAGLLARHGIAPGERLVALQAGASNAIRQWPPEHFAALGRLLEERLGARVVLVGAARERELSERIAAEIGPRAIVATGETSLPQLGALLARAALLVTGDTGPMHIATALGTPVVALFFGPAFVWETGPYGADNIVFQTDIECSPCNHMVTCLAPICRERLTSEMVFWAVHDRLAHDYARLAERARTWSGAHVYRVAFDAEGMCDPIPLAPRLNATEALRLVYREMWRTVLDHPPGSPQEEAAYERLRARWRARGTGAAVDLGGPTRALESLRTLAGRGEALAGAFLREMRGGDPSIERLEELGGKMEALDCEIERQGHIEDAVATLARMFVLGKENVSDTQALEVLGQEALELYRQLGRWAAFSLRLAAVIDGTGQRQESSARWHPPRPAPEATVASV
jgi:lipopolysaccharide heptosyltransferase II